MFWMGYAAAVASYFFVGIATGIYIVVTNLARFHGGGFQVRRMIGHVALISVFWPGAVLEMIETRT